MTVSKKHTLMLNDKEMGLIGIAEYDGEMYATAWQIPGTDEKSVYGICWVDKTRNVEWYRTIDDVRDRLLKWEKK